MSAMHFVVAQLNADSRSFKVISFHITERKVWDYVHILFSVLR